MADALTALVADGRRIATALGAPQDIEWTMDSGGGLWFVQARPITVLPPEGGSHRIGNDGSHSAVEDGGSQTAAERGRRQVLWSNANVNENFPEPITPLLYSVAAPATTTTSATSDARSDSRRAGWTRSMSRLRQIIGVHGARMYYNLTSIHSVLRVAPFGEQLAGAFNQFVGADELAAEEAGRTRWRDWRAVQALELARIAALGRPGSTCSCTRRVETFERTVRRLCAADGTRVASPPRSRRRSGTASAASWRSGGIAGRTRRSPMPGRWSATPR